MSNRQRVNAFICNIITLGNPENEDKNGNPVCGLISGQYLGDVFHPKFTDNEGNPKPLALFIGENGYFAITKRGNINRELMPTHVGEYLEIEYEKSVPNKHNKNSVIDLFGIYTVATPPTFYNPLAEQGVNSCEYFENLWNPTETAKKRTPKK